MDSANQPAGQPDKPEHNNGTSHRGMFDRIADASAGIACQPLAPGLTLEFRVRYIGVSDAARLGVLMDTLNQLLGELRQPEPEDLDGLAAAEMEARRMSDEERAEKWQRSLENGKRIVRDVVEAVRDLDDPNVWRPVLFVDGPEDEGEDDSGVRLWIDRVIRIDGLSNILSVALSPASAVAGRWRPFLDK
tara:strand:+ start:2140 stop:2709 length:570 start_codon:yes stop_codon:yes gene_type:complete